MNIYKYIYESGLIAQGCWDKFDDYDQKALEKFAELIVRECIAQARSEEDRFYGIGEDDSALTMEHFQEVLKHHFGVEE